MNRNYHTYHSWILYNFSIWLDPFDCIYINKTIYWKHSNKLIYCLLEQTKSFGLSFLRAESLTNLSTRAELLDGAGVIRTYRLHWVVCELLLCQFPIQSRVSFTRVENIPKPKWRDKKFISYLNDMPMSSGSIWLYFVKCTIQAPTKPIISMIMDHRRCFCVPIVQKQQETNLLLNVILFFLGFC